VTRSIVRITVEAEDQVDDSTRAFRLMELTQDGDLINNAYYQNRSDGLYIVSGSDDPSSLPKNSHALSNAGILDMNTADLKTFSLFNPHFGKPNSSSVRCALKYPLKAGTEWSYTEKNRPRRVNKKVIGETTVQTNTGSFKAVQVQWIVDFDGDDEFDDIIEYYDYIANEGLVKRSFLIKKLPVVDDDGGNIGSYDYLDESLLSSVTLK
jgi:hypothetical protein